MDNVPFTDETRSFGQPKDWVEELDGPCLTISVHDYVEPVTGLTMMRTGWRPDADQLAQLNAGGYIVPDISGRVHPVIKIFTAQE